MDTRRPADVLFDVFIQKHTGFVSMRYGPQTARFAFHDGELVRVDAALRGQSMVGALLKHKRLSLETLDLLWARGEADLRDDASLDELKLSRREAVALHSVERLVASMAVAESISVEPGQVNTTEPLVGKVSCLRAAFAAMTFDTAVVFRRISEDIPPWLQEEEELAAYIGLTGFSKVNPRLRPIFELLARHGDVEVIEEAVYRERLRQEEKARQEEEERERERAAAEERAREEERARQEEEAKEKARQEEEERERERAAAEERAREEARARQEEEAREKARQDEEERERERAAAEERAREEERARLEEEAREKARQEEEEREKARAAAEERAQEAERARLEEEAKEKARQEEEEREREKARAAAEERAREEERARQEEEAREKARQEEEEREKARVAAEERAREEERARLEEEAKEKARQEEEERERARAAAEERAQEEARARQEEEAREKARQEEAERAAAEAHARNLERESQLARNSQVLKEQDQVRERARVRAEEEALRERKRQSLIEQMNEALRASMTVETEEPELPLLDLDVVTEPSIPQATVETIQAAQTPAEESDARLWQIVDTGTTEVMPMASSFEEALQRVDWSLETLVNDAPPLSDVPTETTSQQTEFDVSESEEEQKRRRQRMLRQGMENLGTLVKSSNSAVSSPSGVRPSGLFETLSGVASAAGTPSSPSLSGARVPQSSPSLSGAKIPQSSPSLSGAKIPQSSPSLSGARVPQSSQSSARLTTFDAELAASIESRYIELSTNKNHFAVLGVAPGADKDAIRLAFHALAKTFHPDRLPQSLAHLSEQTTSVFERIREAYDILSDDVRRAVFESALSKVKGVPAAQSPAERSADLLKRGELALKKRDFSSAEQLFIEAHQWDGSANSLAARAWCIYMDPQRKAEVGTAKKLMLQAVGLDSNCDRAHYQLGVVARVEGSIELAERHFRSAVKANPRHLEANQELRLIEMRKKKEKKGFFG